MNRTIIECPICGEWSGPEEGEAVHTISRVCEECEKVLIEKNVSLSAHQDKPGA